MLQLLLFLAALASAAVRAEIDTHVYAPGEEVHVWANKIGPYHNPQETYQYYTLPFCPPPSNEVHPPDGIGEVLEGNELRKSNLHVKFMEDQPVKEYCSLSLTNLSAEIFKEAVRQHYWYQFMIDDLPVWGFLGELYVPNQESVNTPDAYVPYMSTHMQLDLGYNGDRVIEANLTTDVPVRIEPGKVVSLTYAVNWVQVEGTFMSRYNRYLDNNFFENQVHWFSIFNSFMMVIFLTGLVSMILMRTLKSDYAKYSRRQDLEMDGDLSDETGWKQVSADVFRPPAYLEVFSALLGTGAQLLTLVFLMILIAITSTWEVSRAKLTTAIIIFYALTSFTAGYTGGSYYAQMQGRNWIRTCIFTACGFPGLVFSVVFFLNSFAIVYSSLSAIPFSTIVAIVLIWVFISFPLTLAGTIVGRNWNSEVSFPCRLNSIPRPIPEKPWYLSAGFVCMAGGLLPFASIFIEMYFIFNSFWLYKFYFVYGFMLLVFVILVVVTVCVTIVSTYFLLNAEDYRWPWISFLSAASTAIYVFLYAVYFFAVKTRMSGAFQTAYYFGYMGLFCTALACLCGAVGFKGSSVFCITIYRAVKSD